MRVSTPSEETEAQKGLKATPNQEANSVSSPSAGSTVLGQALWAW